MQNEPSKKTAEVSLILDVPPYTLAYLIRQRKIARPPQDISGDYVWGPEHVEAARAYLAARKAVANA